MTMRAMSISIFVKSGLALALAAIALNPAYAQQEKEKGVDVKDVASTPLEDIGVMGKDIPDVLQIAARDPYDYDGLTTCNAIVAEIASLDQVLGEDYDLAGETEAGINVNSAAKGVVGSLIPFRGIVREVSGAAGDQRKAQAAVTAGMVRRGYLKGLGQSRGCTYPARPKLPEPEPEPE